MALPSWLGIALSPVIIPLAFVAKLVAWPFERPVKRTRAEVVSILGAYLRREASDSSWDDFVCVPIADARLESIRRYCVDLPWVPLGSKGEWLSVEQEGALRAFVAELEGAA